MQKGIIFCKKHHFMEQPTMYVMLLTTLFNELVVNPTDQVPRLSDSVYRVKALSGPGAAGGARWQR